MTALFSRRLRLVTVLLSLCALLYGQVALAAYVCPGAGQHAAAVQDDMAGMPCAGTMATDQAQPTLCHAHCQGEAQSAGQFHLPAFAGLDQLGVFLMVAPAPAVLVQPAFQRPLLQRATAPPLAVRHCCLRI